MFVLFIIQSFPLLTDANVVTKAIGSALTGLSERLKSLEQKHQAFGLPKSATGGLSEIRSHVPIPSECTTDSQTAERGKKRRRGLETQSFATDSLIYFFISRFPLRMD